MHQTIPAQGSHAQECCCCQKKHSVQKYVAQFAVPFSPKRNPVNNKPGELFPELLASITLQADQFHIKSGVDQSLCLSSWARVFGEMRKQDYGGPRAGRLLSRWRRKCLESNEQPRKETKKAYN